MSSDGNNGPVIIKGIQDGFEGGEPPMRLELRDMANNHQEQWTLFLLGLERFQKVDEKEPLSYFQIAGIHGLPAQKWPNADWNDVGSQFDKEKLKTVFGGYCTHTSILFLTWHRVYLALFEGELYKHVNYIAREFEKDGKPKYIKAAKTFRLPYWDWAEPELPLYPKEALSAEEYTPERPKSQEGKPDEFPRKMNPLARYEFGKYSQSQKKQESNLNENRTSRTFGGIDDIARKKALIEWLNEFKVPTKGMNVSERIIFLLQSYTDFGGVSNNEHFGSPDTRFNNWGSIEDVHNAVHVYVGNYMGNVKIAAFDPIFWLHHANIDRIFAIWQACNPGKYVTPQKSTGNTVFRARGVKEDKDTSLPPFAHSLKEDGSQVLWTSVAVEKTKDFGYVYPETQSKFKTRNDVLNEVDRLYKKRASFANILRTQPLEAQTLRVLQDRAKAHLEVSGTESVELPAGRDLRNLAVGNKYLEWLVNIKANKHELDGNYIVNIFIGDPSASTDPLLYMKDHAHVGSFATFGRDEHSSCENCKKGRDEDQRITGQIPLTIALVERYLAGQIESLAPEHVVAYLNDNIRWKVTLPNGELRSPGDLRNLLVCVVSNEVTFDPNDPTAVPKYSDVVTAYENITNDIPESFNTGYDGRNY
ncbi:hypothetical protein HER10_EVM0007266 [Colletotrichum scovillei]|uniref:uncharacterized protein n=1 Tax=Colletotrichum scovillei TaxID=1209932 RepID=UPI0015C402AB|nr:uncharacterized protein HER10_EVM0007266 [Colletotrichum scovillei]KAF4773968.1 hypothetical protein HER10_EVM0007266 [Colletotrichum scovillei]